MESPTRKWVLEPPSHHRRHTACWDEVRHRRTTEISTNLRSFHNLGDNSSKPPDTNTQFPEEGGPRRAANMMEEKDRFQVPSAVQEAEMQAEMQPLRCAPWPVAGPWVTPACWAASSAAIESQTRPEDPASSTASEADSDTREGEPVTINYKPSPLQRKIEKQRDLARKGSLKNGTAVGSPVNQQPKKNNVMARTRLVVPNKGYSSLDQSPDEKPLVALDTDSDDDFDMSRYSSSGYSSAEQINQDLNIQLLKDGYRLDEIPDDEDLDLILPKSVNPTCMCCQATSSTTCQIQ
ncbi:hypothetical protein NQZ68_027859 [Dissostichus eleginoides]|nr:hypothetical protein NQZ68_027859 [Dissostichus eleginoides]